mmetsp:Transcript_132690/g.296803  ORF Transcript_132690/g.296803 Transcript_132690/m.296803 type:complete len:952 (+) Transcript_132690:123-2978(+)
MPASQPPRRLPFLLAGCILGVGSGVQVAPAGHSVASEARSSGGQARGHGPLLLGRDRGRSGVLTWEAVGATAWAGKPETAESLGDMPTSRRQLYFRPVSVTLWCVMALAVQCLMVYTSLAVARNVEELSGATENTLLTETLTCAARSSSYPPILGAIFVGCRMYVLASTEGLGEPPIWVKVCMVVSTVGMTCQFLTVLILPFASVQRAKERLRLSELAGEPSDVHPMLGAHKFRSPSLRLLFQGGQAASMICLYGGAMGVIVGVLTWNTNPGHHAARVSPAVGCTIFLGAVYLLVNLLAWWARSHFEISVNEQARLWQTAALAASMVVRKVPMLVMLFLGARMRALQLDPPHGMPTLFAQACMVSAAALILVETLAAACVGFLGREDPEKSTIGVYAFTGAPRTQTCQNVVGLLSYVLIVMICHSINTSEAPAGEITEALSPTMRAVLQLAGIFFLVHGLHACVIFYQDLFQGSLPKCQTTLVGASVSVTICPLLAVLFLACRMRALQITNQQGNPQSWAQNCMGMCVFATAAQAICCLCLPLFTGAAAAVDEDGNATYNLRPMVGAYTVSAVKYMALLCLHGGVIAVCVAVFTMTPETTMHENTSKLTAVQQLIWIMGWAPVVLIVVMILSSAKVVGLAVKLGIESVDTLFLGVDITVDKAVLGLLYGYVKVGNLVVHNPSSHGSWTSQYLVKVDQMVVKVNVWRAIRSLGKQFEITTLKLQGVQVCYDLPGLGKHSNVQYVLDHLKAQSGPSAEDSAAGAEGIGARAIGSAKAMQKEVAERTAETYHRASEKATEATRLAKEKAAEAGNALREKAAEVGGRLHSKGSSAAAEEKPAPPPAATDGMVPEVILKQIVVTDLGAAAYVAGMMLRFDLADINFDNFEQQLGENKKAVVAEVVREVLMTILKTILSNRHIATQALSIAGQQLAGRMLGRTPTPTPRDDGVVPHT